MWRAALVGGAAALAFALIGHHTFGMPAATPRSAHERGRAVYNFRCYFCHGYSGDAQTQAASMMQPRPRDFTRSGLDAGQIERAVRDGRAGTAMQSFQHVIPDTDIAAVAEFVAAEFVRDRAPNTAYHTAENGWPRHERYAAAFPFVRGDIAPGQQADALDAAQREGRALYLNACVSCHDHGRGDADGPAWSARPVSDPRMGFVPGQAAVPTVDAVSSASVYALHDVAPRIAGLSPRERRGQPLFQQNCSFCHGADGTGKNWIGQFMEPKARDLTQYSARTLPPATLRLRIREGLPNTSMPAWQHVLRADEIDAVAAYVARAFFRVESAARH